MKNQFKYIFLIVLLGITAALFAGENKIEKISFRNVQFKGEENLKDIIHSKKGQVFEARLMKLDKILLTNYFLKQGFLDVAIYDSTFLDRKNDKTSIIYSIKEGQRYYYSGVRFKGNKEIPTAKLIKQFKEISLLSPFDESRITASAKLLENVYYNEGKPFVNTDINYLYEQDSLISVLVSIEENQTVYIKDIHYLGRKLVQKFLIRRELELKKGDRYNRRALDESQQNLYGMGLFRYVRFEIEPIADQPDQVILKIMVQERDPRWIGVRFGVAHEQEAYYGNKFELTLQGGHRNIYGTARSLSLHLTPSFIYDFDVNKLHNPENKVSMVIVEPWIFNTRTTGVLNGAYQQYRPLNSGNFDLWRTSLDIRKLYRKRIELSGSISAQLVEQVSGSEIDSSLVKAIDIDKNAVYSLTLYARRDKRKNIFNPTNGSYTDLSLSFSYSSGRDENDDLETNRYVSVSASWQRYQPWRPKVLSFKRWHFTFASRLKMGAILEPFATKTIPINDRFYAGGATTVRGYQEQLLGPALSKDKNGYIEKAAGGKAIFLANVEARIPFFWLFVLETFVDAGNVWKEVEDVRGGQIKVSTGLGLALITPLGPVRVDYGYKLMRGKQDPTPDAFHLGIYFAF